MEQHSIYAEFNIEPHAYAQWLQNQTPSPGDFDDWPQMHAAWDESWKQEFRMHDPQSVDALLAAWKADQYNESPLYTNYDQQRGVFTLFQAFYDENLINIANGISRLRGVQEFCKPDVSSYILVAPLFWSQGVTALLEIHGESSRFLKPDDAPAALLDAANALLREQMRAMSGG